MFRYIRRTIFSKIQRRGKRKGGEKNSSKEKIDWDDLEAIAYGFGLLPKEFWSLTFHEFFLLQRGRNEQLEMTERFEWERTRWLACLILQPHKKKNSNLNPTDLVRFEWEKKEEKMDLEKRKKAAEYAVKKYKIEIPENNEND